MAIVDYLSTNLSPVADWLTGLVKAYPGVATVITIATVASSVWTNHKNRAATVFGHSMQAITHLDQRWESEDLKLHRRAAARFLLYCNDGQGCTPNATASDEESVNAVLNFLETVGCFVRTNAIAPRTAWQLFGSAAQLYVEAAAKQLADYRNPHTTVYSEIQYLYLASRVEEERRTWPFAWLCRRVTAVSLTFKSGVGPEKNMYGRFRYVYHMLYSTVLSRVHEDRHLPRLFSREEVFKYLRRESRLQLVGGEGAQAKSDPEPTAAV